MDSRKVSVILMAAGESVRMGRDVDKLLLPYNGKALLQGAVDLLAEIPFGQVILVTTETRLKRLCIPARVTVVLNSNPHLGQSESLRLGVEAATGDGYLFCTGDQPLLNRQALDWLLAAADGEHIVYPAVEGTPHSPALFPARFRQELLAQQGDAGGRGVREAHPSACLPLEAEDPEAFRDIDTPEEYTQLLYEQY